LHGILQFVDATPDVAELTHSKFTRNNFKKFELGTADAIPGLATPIINLLN